MPAKSHAIKTSMKRDTKGGHNRPAPGLMTALKGWPDYG